MNKQFYFLLLSSLNFRWYKYLLLLTLRFRPLFGGFHWSWWHCAGLPWLRTPLEVRCLARCYSSQTGNKFSLECLSILTAKNYLLIALVHKIRKFKYILPFKKGINCERINSHSEEWSWMWIKLYLYSKKKENSWISDKIKANAKIQTYAAKDQIWLALCQHICLDSNVYQPYYIYSLDIHLPKIYINNFNSTHYLVQ